MSAASVAGLLASRRVLLAAPGIERATIGVFFGTEFGCLDTNDRYHRGLVESGPLEASPLLFAQTIPSAPAGEVAIAFGLSGPSTTIMSGRDAGLLALAEARRALRLGRCEHALVLAGDVVGEAVMARLRLTRPSCREAMVAVLLGHDASSGEAPLGLPSSDFLGASGLVELLRP